MNYSAMIQNRKSVRAFRGKEVPNEALAQLRTYYEKTCPRLVPEIATELIVLDKDAQPALESSAGYQQFLIGAPHYLLLMSARHIHAGVNAGYMMEDLVLKLTELDIDTCWLTFTDSDKIKKALSLTTPLEVAAIVAFGYGEKTVKKLLDAIDAWEFGYDLSEETLLQMQDEIPASIAAFGDAYRMACLDGRLGN